MSYVDIKDRIADGDDIFRVEALGDGRIRLIPEPNSVTEKGTPINKQLLQPLVDAQNVVDISDDFVSDANSLVKHSLKQVYKIGQHIIGYITCDFVDSFEPGTGVQLEDTLFHMNEKYAPLSDLVIPSAFALVDRVNMEPPADYKSVAVFFDEYDMRAVILHEKVQSIFMSFNYICKGDEENDN